MNIRGVKSLCQYEHPAAESLCQYEHPGGEAAAKLSMELRSEPRLHKCRDKIGLIKAAGAKAPAAFVCEDGSTM
jgi:hypothetical protein